MKFARFLGRINSRIILTIFYFTVFGFVAVIRKAVLGLKSQTDKKTNWQDKEELREEFYRQQF